MINYIKGTITEINPASVTVETAGVGYLIQISVNTYSKLGSKTEVKILIHEVIREDSHQLFGFADSTERDIFRLLTTKSNFSE